MKSAARDAFREGREARRAGKERKSPYEGIGTLRSLHAAWLSGWDTMRMGEAVTNEV